MSKWSKENQALWEIFKACVRAFRIAKVINIEQEDDFLNSMQEYVDDYDKN